MQLAGSTPLNLANYFHQSVQIYSEDLHKIKDLYDESYVLSHP